MKLNKLITILFCLTAAFNYAQRTYPKIVTKNEQNYLMLSQKKTILLKDHSVDRSEFEIIAINSNRAILHFIHPSKTESKGRCASGEEKGFLLLHLDDINIINSEIFILESCLWQIESEHKTNSNKRFLEFTSVDLNTSKTYILKIDTTSVLITKTDN